MRFFVFGFFAAIAALVTPAHAAVILNVNGAGQLVGAQNVEVGGTFFDVTFVGGSCVSVFDGCDANSDFEFQSAADAAAAAQALLDQVFLDGALGSFDSDPELTSGCGSLSVCITYVPFEIGSPLLNTFFARNGAPDFLVDDARSFGFVNPAITLDATQNFALFTPSTQVSEPMTATLFLTGLFGVAGLRRGRRRSD